MTATATASPRFYAVRAEGRYRVIDGDLIDARQDGDAPGTAYVATCSSRAKAEEKAAKLNAESEEAEMVGTFGPRREDSPADARQADAKLAAEMVAAGTVSFEDAAAALLTGTSVLAAVSPAAAKGTTRTETGAVVLASGLVEGSEEANAAEAAEMARLEKAMAKQAPAKPAPAKAASDTQAWRIGKLLREWVLAHPRDTDAVLVDHIATRNVCYDGTATLRVSAQWVEELSAAATALENAATGTEATVEAALRAPSVRAARASRTGLAKLF